MADIVKAKTGFRLGRNVVGYGQVFSADSDIVKGREHLFETVEAGADKVRVRATVPRDKVLSPPPDPASSDDDAGSLERPAGNGSQQAWVAYVAALTGRPTTELEPMTRTDLIYMADRAEVASRSG